MQALIINVDELWLKGQNQPFYVKKLREHIELVLRRNAGDFCYITPGALHHSSFRSEVEAVYFNLYVPGTDKDTASLKLK